MRSRLFRGAAGLVVVLCFIAIGLTIRRGDFQSAFPFGLWTLLLGFLLIIPTFSIYAIKGEKAGNRMLARVLRLQALPEALFQRLIGRHLEIPPELMPEPVVEREPPEIEGR